MSEEKMYMLPNHDTRYFLIRDGKKVSVNEAYPFVRYNRDYTRAEVIHEGLNKWCHLYYPNYGRKKDEHGNYIDEIPQSIKKD